MAGKKNPVKTEATRQKLLEVSFGLFTQRNIGSVSLGEITKAAGYGPATVYRYYSSKPKLVVAVA
nr:TetR/AcrR family transcriptional regulator [Clostridia bacterium]